jgi:3-hydroxyisobutyrate dehydrogenase
MTLPLSVGYIGLGNIGGPSARHLIGRSWQAHVYDVWPTAMESLVGEGAIPASSVADLAVKCQHIGICVRDDQQVESLLYGAAGILENAAADTVVAIHSTVSRAGLLRWAADASERGLHLIDAAISGGKQGAEEARLCYMVGGAAEIVERARPVFLTSGNSVIHAGDLGTGLLLKLCNNLITYAEFMAMSEAVRLAEAGGLAPELLREVGKSNGVVNEMMSQFISNRNALARECTEEQMDQFFGDFGRLAEKDLDCALQSAEEMGVSLPSTRRLRDQALALFLNKA